MTDTRHRMELADYVRELTETHHHVEQFTIIEGATLRLGRHLTKIPSLIVQLHESAPSSSGEERAQAGYASRPTARIEALDCLTRIDLEAARWVRDLGEDDPPDTAACVRRLHGLSASAADVTVHAIEYDVRRWWTQARIVAGLDSPAWRPDNTCPLCGVRGGLRVKLSDQSGFCTECRETWTPETVGLLADHVRAENHDEMFTSEDAG